MSGFEDWPILDFAIAHTRNGALDCGRPLRGIRVALARGLAPPAAAVLAARLRRAGGDVGGASHDPPCIIVGAGDEDLTGQLGATSQAPRGPHGVPVVDLSKSALMQLAHDHVGLGQASVMALLDITNLQLAGRTVVVCGYGSIGAGVAAHAAALGGRVSVVEADALRAAHALAHGHSVHSFAGVLPQAEVVFVTNDGPGLGFEQLRHIASGAILCTAGPFGAAALAEIKTKGPMRPVRAHVEAFDLPHANGLKLIAGGQPLHLASGKGLPRKVQDIILALHVLALGQLLRDPSPDAGTAPLAADLEGKLAEQIVTNMGGQLEAKTSP